MAPLETLELDPPLQAKHTDPANEPSDVSRSRSRRVPAQVFTSGFLDARFDIESPKITGTPKRPLYEFSGSPDIIIDDDKGQSRPANEGDYKGRPITGSESRGSEEESSVYKVKDLGFEAAAAIFPESFCNSSDCHSVIVESLEAVFEKRTLRRSSCLQKPQGPNYVQSRLRKEVEKALDWSQFDKEEYLPLDSFESIFDIKSIALLLDETYGSATDEELRDKFASILDRRLCRSRRRILGVLVFMSRVAHIEHFIREHIWDDQLPLERLPGSSTGRVRTRNAEEYNLMKGWSRDEVELFCLYQKMFFAPFFDIQENRLCSYELELNSRLPWKVFEHKTSGGFGVVHKVEIHPSHHNFARSASSVEPVFALKAIEAGDHKAYREELSALEKTCAKAQKEKHLIKLLLTFRHGEKFYLLFEWADGNLEEFWKTHSFGPPTALHERWAAEQCLGLARAVSRIHGLTTWQKRKRSSSVGSLIEAERDWGRHGDIKPENILWFEEYGNDRNLLVITDLGLTRYHSQFSKSFVPRSNIDGCSWAYRPPELDMDERISQKYDIWSLGCVFLEFCVWYLQGHDQVEAFSFQRIDADVITYENVEIEKFFNIEKLEDGQRRPRVKQVVEERLKALKNPSICTTFAEQLLHVIEDKMLRCSPDNREKIDVICTDLSNILASLPKETNPEKLSQDLAFMGREEPVSFVPAPGDISLYEEPHDLSASSPNAPTRNGSNATVATSTRSQRSRREDGKRSKGRKDHVPGTDTQGGSKTLAANGFAATAQKELQTQSSKTGFGPKPIRTLHKDVASPHVPSQPPSTNKPNKTKHRISQKSKKWFREPLNHFIRMWKG